MQNAFECHVNGFCIQRKDFDLIQVTDESGQEILRTNNLGEALDRAYAKKRVEIKMPTDDGKVLEYKGYKIFHGDLGYAYATDSTGRVVLHDITMIDIVNTLKNHVDEFGRFRIQ
jgi:hypothetical protein